MKMHTVILLLKWISDIETHSEMVETEHYNKSGLYNVRMSLDERISLALAVNLLLECIGYDTRIAAGFSRAGGFVLRGY